MIYTVTLKELAGEIMDFYSQVCGTDEGAFQHLKDDVSVVLIHGGPDVLPVSKYSACRDKFFSKYQIC